MFKKIYVEATNHCNIKCSFCKTNVRKKLFLSLNDFNLILDRIKGYTNFIYLHVLGEPLINPDIDKYIISAKNNHIRVNITTNGTLLKERKHILLNKYIDNIHQINISMHCEYERLMSFDEYFDNVVEFSKQAAEQIYINLRLWDEDDLYISEKNKFIINKLFRYFDCVADFQSITFKRNRAITLSKNIFLHLDKKFTWPNLNGKEIFTGGKCYALKDQIAILCDGTIVPCCLDGDGAMSLGNIFKDGLEKALRSERALAIKDGFANGSPMEKYCRTCGFAIRNNSQ